MNSSTCDRGKSGESAAERFMISQGFTVLARNFRFGRRGEIDLIVSRDDLLVFVEVKTRTGEGFGGALRSINGRKIGSMRKTASFFLSRHQEWLNPSKTCRFDLVAVRNDGIVWEKDILR